MQATTADQRTHSSQQKIDLLHNVLGRWLESGGVSLRNPYP
ncbi:hypothetical protein SynA1825c_02347 [Synechococcus sp. A18-25c]|nr:hypothetical protein SynA1560_02385 [Synechococcus sp. A15-60]QNJ20639.1 hypothetical protein SynA1825c_02347 [Synechococcus sp. A18-25c]